MHRSVARIPVALAVAAALLLPHMVRAADKGDAPAGPKTGGPAKMAFIDITQITEKYGEYKKAKEELEKRQEDAKKKLKSLEERIKKLEEDYKAKESMLKDDAKKKMQDQYQKLLEEYQKTGRASMAQLADLEASATQQILTEIKSTVKALAVQKNYELVVDKNAVLYGSDDLGVRFADDITDDVLKILNKK
jgi:outer membrane protein